MHKIFLNNKFVLLNLDYDGRGDFYSKFISQDNKKYGQLESTDAVWVKDPNSDGGEGEKTKEFMNIALPFFQQMEKGLECSAACWNPTYGSKGWTPAFGVGRNVKDGPPT